MGKIGKIALALLYAVQIVVIFRDSIVHLYNRNALEGPAEQQKQSLTGTQTAGVQRAVWQRLFLPRFQRQGMITAAATAGAATAAALTEIKRDESEVHPPETKKDFLVRKLHFKRVKEYLLLNLWPFIRKFPPPAPLACCPAAADRRLVFPDNRE